MVSTKEPRTLTTYPERERETQKKSDTCNAVHESLTGFRSTRRREKRRRNRRKRSDDVKVLKEVSGGGNGEEEDEKGEVERKIVALQRIVPGGEYLEMEKLFEETAGYILALQTQVEAMRLLANFFEGLEKEKRKLGG